MAKNYPPHTLVQFGGTLGFAGTSPEEWSCSVRVATTATAGGAKTQPTQVEQEAYLASIVNDIKTAWQSPFNGVTSQAKLEYIKANAIAADGKYLFKNTASGVTFVPIPGPGSNSSLFKPFQVSIVISLGTGFKRGLAHRGRFYLPTPTAEVSMDGKISAQGVMANIWAQCISDMKYSTVTGLTYTPAVVSAGTLAVPTGTSRPITEVLIGNVLDTQRRRRNDLVETYVAAPVT